LCTLFSVGLSHQGRPLWCLKISDNPGQDEDEPACFFNGATHAREPMGTSCCIIFASRILSQFGTDSLATWLINNREIFIVPVMNPDGYVYNSDSGGASSNWRKNRRVIQAPYVGVDLNRNYGYKWGYDNSGSSPQPSSETYRGPERFSEPETRVMRDFMAAHLFRTEQDFHTYGQYNMYPWGYASATPPDRYVLQEIVDTFRMNNRYRASRTGQIYQTIYPCNGVSCDWEFADTAGKFVTYAFTTEMDSVDFWHGWNDSGAIRLECDRNIPNLYYLARICGVFFEPVGLAINDTAQGNANGQLDPGEEANIWFTIRNRAVHPLDSAYSVSARLSSSHPDVQVTDSVKQFPNSARGSTVTNRSEQFRLSASPQIPPGTHVPLRLEVSYNDAGHAYRQPLDFELIIGSSPALTEKLTQPLPPLRLNVRPNPARARLNFEFGEVVGPSRLELFSSTGTLLSSSTVKGSGYQSALPELPAGVYYARLISGSGSAVTQFLLVR
ncbi:MAG: M14 family zinc carboxypeptidase, partial [candidate division WOR-3 bacterium]